MRKQLMMLSLVAVLFSSAGEVAAGTQLVGETSPGQTINLSLPVAHEPNTYPLGQCTWGAKMLAPWVPNWLGNAKDWYAKAAQMGFSVGQEPRVGAVVVWAGGEGDAYGHVAVVTEVVDEDELEVMESNVNEIKEIRNFRGRFNPHQTLSGQVLGYIYPPEK